MCYVCLGCGGCGRPKSPMFLCDTTCLKCGAKMRNGVSVCTECGFDQTPGAPPKDTFAKNDAYTNTLD